MILSRRRSENIFDAIDKIDRMGRKIKDQTSKRKMTDQNAKSGGIIFVETKKIRPHGQIHCTGLTELTGFQLELRQRIIDL